MTKSQALRNEWSQRAATLLVGRTIVAVRYLDDGELADCGWDRSCLALFLDDGSHLMPSSDDEGNAAGVLFYDGTDEKSSQTFGVI